MVNLFIGFTSGVLLSAAFAPLSVWWIAPIALSFHMYSLNRGTKPFLNSFVFALAFNAVTLHWTSIYVGAMPWIILFIGQSLMFVPLGLSKRHGVSFYPLIFFILEEIRSYFPFGGFGWLRLAFSQADAPYRNIAAYGGVSALSATVLCSALVLFTFINRKFTFLPLLPLFILFASISMNPIGSTKVLMVQGDVPQLGLDFNSRASAVFNNHVQETKKALSTNSEVDFILWPENAVDIDPFTNQSVGDTLNAFEKPLIVGAVIRSQGELRNVSIAWTKESQIVYIKQHLTPFGEYVPLRSIASKVSPLAHDIEDFSPGQSSKIFTIDQAEIAPVICFELIDDEILSKAATNSNLIVVQTNSATFGSSPESAQQLEISRVRAIEHGRNILSVSTTGISAIIDYRGNVSKKTRMHLPAHIFADVSLIRDKTPRDKAGQWALLATGFWLMLVAKARRLTHT